MKTIKVTDWRGEEVEITEADFVERWTRQLDQLEALASQSKHLSKGGDMGYFEKQLNSFRDVVAGTASRVFHG